MEWLQLVAAAICFSVGGLCMKLSAGATRSLPTAAFLILFVIGALLQAWAMRRTDLGPAYIAVLGIEAVMTLIFSALLLRESYSLGRLLGVMLIITGVALLRRS